MPLSNFQYNDGAVPFGSRLETIKRGTVSGATTVGDFVLESINLTYPSKVTERPDQIGQPNGWFAVSGFPHGTAVVQIPTQSSGFPNIGDWFEDTFGNLDGSGNPITEHWVIVDKSQPFAIHDYWKCNVTLRVANNPP